MNNPEKYTDEELLEIIMLSKDAIRHEDSHYFQAWLLGGLISAKRELDRRDRSRPRVA